ncbi:MAG: acylneuraminate cytidylyltransferase family protein [Gammaproteobacteria bacterium]|jgi:CMP-N-acetylneuraminic acid synthetase
MSFENKTVLAVIPARGGSKGIPRKNLSRIGGRSLIARAADVVAGLDWLDFSILSTDDEEIAAEGRRYGLQVPFMRPPELAGDRATAVDMWQHAWHASEAAYGTRIDISVLLEPTSPLRCPDDVLKTVRLLVDSGNSSAVTVSQTPAHFTPERTLCIDDQGHLKPYLAEGLRYTSRQMIGAYYYRNGLAYAVTREGLLDQGSIIQDDTLAVPIERPVVNIDEPLDLAWAEFLLQQEPG